MSIDYLAVKSCNTRLGVDLTIFGTYRMSLKINQKYGYCGNKYDQK
jgi:hypothetical protein